MAEAPSLRLFNGVAIPPAGVFDLDPVHTFAEFKARHLVVGTVRGRFDGVTGTFVVTHDPPEASLEVTIDATSIDTKNQMRDEDLRGSHFLDVGRFPTISYRSNEIAHDGGTAWTVGGLLTIRGVERPVALAVTFLGGVVDSSGRLRLGFIATAEIRRTEFGLTWEASKELGSVASGHDVGIEVEAEATFRSA